MSRCPTFTALVAALAVAVSPAAFAESVPGIAQDPSPTDCDAYLYYDGKLSLRRNRPFRPEELVLIGESTRKSVGLTNAWKARDPEAFAASTPDSFRLTLPNGTVMTRKDMVADVRRRMDMVRSIDSITVAVRVDTLAADSAIVRSRQFFSRVLAMPDSTIRRRFSSVTHREVWARNGERWALKGFTEENQVTRWVDEK